MGKVGSGASYLVWYVLSTFHNFSFGESDCGNVAWAQFCTRSGHNSVLGVSTIWFTKCSLPIAN